MDSLIKVVKLKAQSQKYRWSKGRILQKQWKQTEAGRISERASSKRYRESVKGRIQRKRWKLYAKSAKGKATHKSSQKQYAKSDKGKATQKRYNDKRKVIKKIYNQTKYQCICGSIINRSSKSAHMLSKKHMTNLPQG